LIDRHGLVDALIALQPDELGIQRGGERARDLGLAYARLALQEQWLVALEREERGRRQPTIGNVALRGERGLDLLHGVETRRGLSVGMASCAALCHGGVSSFPATGVEALWAVAYGGARRYGGFGYDGAFMRGVDGVF